MISSTKGNVIPRILLEVYLNYVSQWAYEYMYCLICSATATTVDTEHVVRIAGSGEIPGYRYDR